MNQQIRPLFFVFFCFLSLLACEKDHSSLKGTWVGTANVKPFPEFMKLTYDSVPQVQLFYSQVNQETVIDFDGDQVSFPISEGILGLFNGRLEQDTLKGSIILQQQKQAFPCDLLRLHLNNIADVGQLTGLYRVASNHVIEVLPSPFGQDFVGLRIIDYKTGKERIAFPTSTNRFVAGPKLLTPLPIELTFTVVGSDSKQVPGIEFTDNGEVFRAKRMEDVEVHEDSVAKNGEVELAYTLTLPEGEGPFPLIIHVPRAGEITRVDVFDNHLRLFPWQKVAVLRYDKRGCGESTGDRTRASFEDLASDLLAVMKAAQQHPKIDATKIGLSGLDHAAASMYLAANQSDDIRFIMSLGGTALSMEENEVLGTQLRMEMDGIDAPQVNEALTYIKNMFKYLRNDLDSATFQAHSDQATKQAWASYVTSFDDKPFINQWRKRHSFNPVPYMEKLKIPMLLAYGENDLIAHPKYNFPVIKKVFEKNTSTENQLIVYPNANSRFYLGETRGDLQLTEIVGYAPDFFPKIQTWVLKQFGMESQL